VTTPRAAYYGTKPALAAATVVATTADAGVLTSAAATGGDAPTEAEYNALRTDVSNLRTKLNALLGAMRAAGVLAP
jgi:hypothetical protein